MISKDDAVLYTLLEVAKANKKPYCWPSQVHICHLVEKFYKVPMSRRNLNRVFSRLEEAGFLERVRRHRKGLFGGIVFCSTLYKLKGKLFNWLYSMKNRLGRLYSFYRVPLWAQHKSLGRELDITSPPQRYIKAPVLFKITYPSGPLTS